MKKLFIILLLISSCAMPLNKTNIFSSIELSRLGIEYVSCICDYFENCECNIYLENNFPDYNKEQIEEYICNKINSTIDASCIFYYGD